jgi:hypothetical protein
VADGTKALFQHVPAKLTYLREAASAWPEPNRYTAACEAVEEVVARSRDFVKAVELQEKALRHGYWNQNHSTAVAAASMRLEVAIVALDDDGIPL